MCYNLFYNQMKITRMEHMKDKRLLSIICAWILLDSEDMTSAYNIVTPNFVIISYIEEKNYIIEVVGVGHRSTINCECP